MPRPWIKLYTEMLHDPKVGQLTDSAYRLFVELMLKAGQVDDDGATDTAAALAWELRRQPDELHELLDELEAARLVFAAADNRVVYITSWAKRQPPTTSADRVKRYREKQAEQTSNNGVTLQQRYSNVLDKDIDIEEDKEKEKETRPRKREAQACDIPPNLNTQEFRDIWQEWQQHRIEKRAALKPTTVKRQLKQLADMGEVRAIAALQFSITQGYSGIFEPKGQSANGIPATQPQYIPDADGRF